MKGHGGEALRTLIVDSDPLARLGLSEALGADSWFAVIGESASPPTGETVVADDDVDLVLLSGELLQPEAVEAVTLAVAAGRQVVVYGGQAGDTSLVSALLAAGCSAYLSSQASTTSIARAIRNLLTPKYTPVALPHVAGQS